MIARYLTVLAAAATFAGCVPAHGKGYAWLAPAPAFEPGGHPLTDRPAAPPTMELLYVTDRALEPDDPDILYGFDRGDDVRVGRATVTLGEDLTAEALQERTTTPGRGARARIETVHVDEAGTLDQRRLEDLVAERIEATGQGDVFIAVHGINTGFDDSLFHLAQIWHHLGRPGVPIAYSWPTGMNGWIVNAYGYERESGEFTIPHLIDVLRRLAAMPEVERVHLVAHSMGNTVVLDTLRLLLLQLATEDAVPPSSMKIETLVLAAPDISADVFYSRMVAGGVTSLAQRTVLYVSDRDKALSASSWMHGGRRVGTSSAAQLAHMDGRRVEVVDCSGYRQGGSHDYYLTNPYVLADVLQVLSRASEGVSAGPASN